MALVNSDTPMMKQFNALKAAHPDCILFFRAGDFYEMFGEDAVKASEALNIALTTRNKSSENPVPMAGVPYHAFEQYLNRLTAAGFKVAIAEQMEDPAQAKGVVRREVVRVVTPGTVTADASLESDRPSLLMAVEPRGRSGTVGLALADLTTGQFEVIEFAAAQRDRLYEFIAVEQPREILLPEPRAEGDSTLLEAVRSELERRLRGEGDVPVHMEAAPAAWFELGRAKRRLTAQFETANLAGFGVEHLEAALRAAGALLTYLSDTQKSELAHLSPPRPRLAERMMWLDAATLEHLELFENRSPGARRHTLFAVLNQTRTPMGARLLRRWLASPLQEAEAIEARLEAVEELVGNQPSRDALRGILERVRDLERTIGRVSLPQAGVADMLALREALGGVQILPPLLAELQAPLLAQLSHEFDPLEDIHHYLRERFLEEPSLKLTEGGYIGEGVIGELDALRKLSRGSRDVIAELEAREREATGIGSLKVRYNRVFGYYVEIPRTHQRKVPEHYTRKQTLVNAERYTLPELEELEEKILGAEERIAALEYEAFQEVRTILRGYARRMQRTATRVAALDVLAALAEAAHRNGYTRPHILPPGAERRLSIQGGRHPVIERIDFGERFIPNDLEMSADGTQIVLITGPNMAGKSTVMRQVALIQLMAQAGSFVPATAATLPLVDRIFTRVGASDSLARGQSTFMLEMNEAANILNNATAESLLVLDEIGRGTSTYDGISIAWAMVEHIHRLGALTLFATHYHELTQLGHELSRVKNFNMSIQEAGERLVFTRKLTPGEADRSYGIQVARLAGLPAAVVERAHEVMAALAEDDNGAAALAPQTAPAVPEPAERASTERAARARHQLSFLADVHPMLEEIRALELDGLSPREALEFLYAAQAKLQKGDA
ncbi:MAG TPA: DNA mismatch repair protein MutS [bacterium]|nr:DNA mismatch repair protein MutS [bacterium]